MTHTEFVLLCQERLIDPGIALESETVCEALKARNDEAVKQVLNEEF